MSFSDIRYLPGTFLAKSLSLGREAIPANAAETLVAVPEGKSSSVESDEVLIDRICTGDQEALGLLFRRHSYVVRAVCYRVLRDVSEAEDLVQDVFLLVHKLCKTFDRYKSPARFWILQMAHRRAISRRRYLDTRHFYTRLDLDEAARDMDGPEALAAPYENSVSGRLGEGRLQKVFEDLSENQRQTLQLFFIEGYTFDEIAAKLGQSRGNIKHHYFRGIEKLRKELFGDRLTGEQYDERSCPG